MLAVMSSVAMADQLVFSQYDGVNTWDNVYINVQDAKDYPGAFIDGVSGSSKAGAEFEPETFTVTYEGIGDPRYLYVYVESLTEIEGTRSPEGTSYTQVGFGGAFSQIAQTDEDGDAFINAEDYHLYQNNDFATNEHGTRTEEWEEGQVKVAATHEDPQVRRTIVSVPTGVDMQEFIKDFMSK